MAMQVKPDFQTFYHMYFEKIYRYVFYRVGGSRERAEDLTSEVFMKALEHYESYDPAKSVSSWIYTIAKNHLANAFRDAKPAVSLDELQETSEDAGVIPHNAMAAVLRQAGASDLERALTSVPTDVKQLLLLKFVEGYSYNDLANKYKRSPAALRVAVYRAMRTLREKYRENK